jgi:hypothetical protein
MQFNLPTSGLSATIRDFLPHKVVASYNEAMYRGVKIKPGTVSATKEELLKEFGPETIRSLDQLTDNEYDKRLAELREDYLRRNMEMEGMTLGNVEEANMRKVVGMLTDLGGKPATRDDVDELPHQDFETILEKIEGVADAASKKKHKDREGADQRTHADTPGMHTGGPGSDRRAPPDARCLLLHARRFGGDGS